MSQFEVIKGNPPKGRVCGTCAFCESHSDGQQSISVCFFNPPMPVFTPFAETELKIISVRPIVESHDLGCGNWRAEATIRNNA